MMTGDGTPALGAVYKLSEITTQDNKRIPKIKISDEPGKITNPGFKKTVRIFDNKTQKALADLIMLEEEAIDISKPLKIYHPLFTYKQRVLTDFYTEDMLECIYKKGKLVYKERPLEEIATYYKQRRTHFWDENLRFINPNEYHVDLSDKLFDMKKKLVSEHSYK